MTLLKMSISGAILILIIVVIRALTMHHLPKRTFLLLWGVAVLRLLCPVSVPSVFSIYSWLPKTPSPEVMQTAPAARSVAMQAAPVVAAAEAEAGTSVLGSPWLILWAVGALLCAAVFLLTYVRCRVEFRTSVPVTHAFAAQWRGRHPLKRPLEIRELDRISAPLTYGILHPVILLPKTMDWTEQEKLEYVFLHEYVHIRRFDTVKKLVLAVTVCLHWFNPLVWVLYALCSRDLELVCDEQVVRQLGRSARADYARTLIDMEEIKSGLRPLYNGFSKTAIEERIKAIMKLKKVTIGATLAAVLLVIGVTTVFATSAASEAEKSAYAENQVPVDDKEEAELLAEYAPYGVTERNGDLYYQGALIRWFLDGYEREENIISRYETYNSKGTVDVHTVREDTKKPDGSTELFGPIIDIVPYSQTEFDSREFAYATREAVAVEETTEDSGDIIATAVLEEGAAGAEGTTFQDVFRRYESFGIDYVEKAGESGKGNVYYQGKAVKNFVDISSTDVFTFQSAEAGSVNVCTTYDKVGKLTGVKEVSDPELEELLLRAQANRATEALWQETLAPYAAFGLKYQFDPAGNNGDGDVTMFWNGKEVRGIMDEEMGIWVSAHTGSSTYSADAVELYTVYQKGKLSGLREATAEEMAQWDAVRKQTAEGAVVEEESVNCGGCGRIDCAYCIANGLCPNYGGSGDCGGCGRSDCEYCVENGLCQGYGAAGDCGGCGRNDCETCIANGTCMGYGHHGGGMGQGYRWGQTGSGGHHHGGRMQ